MRLLGFLTFFILTWNLEVQAWESWSPEEMDIFDLVEEVLESKQNFYEYMELTQEATTSEIRKAYRKLSLVLHPDKNDAEDAEIKFRWLAGIYEVLKDKEKRDIYDRVLVEGLPDWRSPAFYFRRMRKIGLVEALLYIFVLITVFQYFIHKAHHWEKKFTLKESEHIKIARKSTRKKQKAAGKTDDEIEKIIEEQEALLLGAPPTIYDTLPFQSWHFGKYLVVTVPQLPSTIKAIYLEHQEKKAEEERIQKEEEEEIQRREDEKREKKERKKEKRRNFAYDEKTEASGSDLETVIKKEKEVFKLPRNANQIWTDVDLAKLARLLKKYPTGKPNRWETIAEILERLPSEVPKMAKKIKDNAFMVPNYQQSQGITGLEKKEVSDDVMEVNYNENGENNEDGEEDSEDEEENTESDEDDYGAYTVASKEDFVHVETKTKVKRKGGKNATAEEMTETTVVETETSNQESGSLPVSSAPLPVPEDVWSQVQQQALESSLKKFPKGTTERFERIANKVPGKTKQQCIQRFKSLAEMVKKKKLEGETTAE